MTTRTAVVGPLILAALASLAPAQSVDVLRAVRPPDAAGPSAGSTKEPGILLPGNTRTSFTWRPTDSAGFVWDIQYNGTVSNGTNNAYSGSGMMLTVNGSPFNWGSEGVLSEDRREVQIGPWQNGTLRVWRRICVPAKGAYCRWIDIFENASTSSQAPKVRYQMYIGGDMQVIQSPSGKEAPGPGEWSFLTADSPNNGSGRPAVVHIFADKGSKVLPKVQATRGNNLVTYEFELAIAAGKTVALCLFESQQSSPAAPDYLRKFRPAAELQSVAPALRRIIANMRGGFFAAGSLEMPRDEKFDLAVLRGSGNELLGTIQDSQFSVETSFGKLDLPAERVVGLAVPADTDSCVQIALTDGQIVAGKLLNEPLRLKLEGGSEMSLPVAKISTVSYRISAERPEQISLTKPAILTRSGQRLSFKTADVNYAFLTEAGQIDLRAEDLASIQLETPEGGLHRAIFRNGSVLAGLLVQKHLTAALDLGPTLRTPASAITQFVFPGEPASTAGLSEATLRNEDVLSGRLAQESFQIKTRFGDVKVAREDLAEMKLAEGAMDRVELKLHSGTTVTGLLVGQKIRFQIVPGPEVPLFVGHVVQITCPKPPAPAATRPATSSPAPAAPSASSEGSSDPTLMAKLKARSQLAEVKAQIQELQARAMTMSTQRADFMVKGKKAEADELAKAQAEIEKRIAALAQEADKLSAQQAEMGR